MFRKKSIFILLTAALLKNAIIFSAETPDPPSPPFRKSDIGFIQIKENTGAVPSIRKFFIVPQSNLPLLAENEKTFYIVVSSKGLSYCCSIPKIAKHTILMEPSEDRNSVYFRGAVEAKTCPFPLEKGEELPVLEKRTDGYLSILRRKGREFNVLVPNSTENVELSQKSLFAKFAEGQKNKGLEYVNGKWISSEKALEIAKKEDDELKKQERMWTILLEASRQGYVVLKDGSVLKGIRKGADKNKIYFESRGREHSISTGDIKDIGAAEMRSEGFYEEALNLYLKASETKADRPGEAVRSCEKALGFLEKVTGNTPVQQKKSLELAGRINLMTDEIQNYLSINGLVLYDYTVQSAKVLDYHLEKGNILLRSQFWVKPEQICQKCSGNGKISCPACNGIGTVKKTCPKCKDGRIICPICDGGGFKPCRICKGSGTYYKICPTCKGSGSVTDYFSTGYPGYFSSQVIISSRTPVVYMDYQPGWSSWGYSTVEKCPVCDGAGQVRNNCWNCRGTGQLPCPKTQICVFCHGKGFTTGICAECNGLKKIECPECKGNGYNGEIQVYDNSSVPDNQGAVSPNSTIAVPIY